MAQQKVNIIGDIINNAYARARRAWTNQDLEGYQKFALLQTELGVDSLDLNLDGTQTLQVRPEEMYAFMPEVIAAIQEVTTTPICFDNPSVEYHKIGLKHYDRSKGGRPIINSLAASRERLDEMIELVGEYDTRVVVMASERFIEGGSGQCFSKEEVYETAKKFVDLLHTRAGRENDHIIIDPGLAPVGADTYGLVNMGLDGTRLIRQDPDLEGVHISVGLTNFAWGTPKHLRHQLERAYLALATEVGLDFALANPEKNPQPLDPSEPLVEKLREVLEMGRPQEGETQEDAGFRQAQMVMGLF